jgi:2-keto-4-pentenoate hydratase/2-oxohepta-3-ene-1,7-dioic acid hydratase in catechol pathway
MRFVRYQSSNDPLPHLGWLLEDRIGAVEGSAYTEFRRLEADRQLKDVRLLAPVQPGKIIGVGRNYIAHVREQNIETPEVPLLFLKPPSSVIGPGDTIILPPQSQQVVHEAELVVVIGRAGRWIQPDDAMDYILGYTIGNDVTARDLQRRDGQWTRGKGFDTFCPLGPWIETEFDPADALMTCHVSGEMRQMASTRDMLFNVRQLIAYISSIMTIEPGDVIMTGTPAGVGILQPGDIVEINIEGLGTLQNPVTREKSW